jgi:hypothetical protein
MLVNGVDSALKVSRGIVVELVLSDVAIARGAVCVVLEGLQV